MQIDGDKVETGDRVYHDRYGWGTVIQAQTGVCSIRFDGSRTSHTFTDGGKLNGYKVLWWSPPVTFTPRKGVNYEGMGEIIHQLMKWKGYPV